MALHSFFFAATLLQVEDIERECLRVFGGAIEFVDVPRDGFDPDALEATMGKGSLAGERLYPALAQTMCYHLLELLQAFRCHVSNNATFNLHLIIRTHLQAVQASHPALDFKALVHLPTVEQAQESPS